MPLCVRSSLFFLLCVFCTIFFYYYFSSVLTHNYTTTRTHIPIWMCSAAQQATHLSKKNPKQNTHTHKHTSTKKKNRNSTSAKAGRALRQISKRRLEEVAASLVNRAERLASEEPIIPQRRSSRGTQLGGGFRERESEGRREREGERDVFVR